MNEEMTEEMNLKVPALDTDVTKGVITSNLRIVSMQLKHALEPYKGKQVTLANYKDAKASRADLNKIRKAFEQRRISLHKDYEQPYDLWLKDYNEVLAEIDSVSKELDVQIKAVEQQLVEDKRRQVQELLDEALGKQADGPYYKALCQLSQCQWFRPKQWDNASYSMSAIQQDIDRQIGDSIQAIELCSKNPAHKAELYERFKTYGSLSDLLRYASEIDARDKAVAAEIPVQEPVKATTSTTNTQDNVPKTEQHDGIGQNLSNPDPNDPGFEFDPMTVHIRKPSGDKQKMVCLFSAEFKCPAYVMKSIQDHLRKAGGDLKVLKFVAVKAN